MSYYTHVTFEFSDEPPPVDVASPVVRAWLVEQNLYAVDHVLQDFEKGYMEGATEFNGLNSNDVGGIMKRLSSECRDISFYVRGIGEEFGDVWLRKFENGEIVYAAGPFEDAM